MNDILLNSHLLYITKIDLFIINLFIRFHRQLLKPYKGFINIKND